MSATDTLRAEVEDADYRRIDVQMFVTATILYLAIGTGAAFAQTQSPATQPSSTLEISKSDKRAVSKACSYQANAKSLHGKVRK